MLQFTLITLLPFLLPISAAPARRNCAVKSSSSSSSSEKSNNSEAIAAFAQHVNNTVLIPTGTGAVIPSIAITSLSVTNKNIAAFDKGRWNGWGGPKSSNVPTFLSSLSQPLVNTQKTSLPAYTQAPATSPSSVTQPPASSPSTIIPSASLTSKFETSQTISSAAPVTTASGSGTAGSGSGEKVGLGLDDTAYSKLTNIQNLGWYWNWGTEPFQGMQSEFVACVWGKEKAESFTGVTDDIKYIMSFNEPDQGANVGGCDIKDTALAATLHQQWTAKVSGDVKIGSPAVARGGVESWFTPWVTACAGNCKYDFIPIHFYGTEIEDLFKYIKEFPRQGKPIWVTEFDCQDFTTGEICDNEKQKDFMEKAINWFKNEGSSYVERWSWFGSLPKFSELTYGLENVDGTLNSLGEHYLSL
ncbi:uncharacterized protein I206_106041 [Kwoniella pini CBS 10737]|uniref:Asl1-like glycosyl hydrolase catalytic domain-containing protein n=1 Tax=Kwoniella pini CBS 10737 TaxID=1296096 RepID=A0A1B9I0V2_9TREE|nr:uncharacterized protein I206_04864 [Kwoniella pini CBS 10737]OCF49176.1 hypothetical protein I206_04864 [Kwoniella pini CBS 10737]